MRGMSVLNRPADLGVSHRLLLLAVWVVGAATGSAAGAFLSSARGGQSTDAQRAQTPLSEIAGAEAPPAAATAPLDQVPTVQAAYEQARAQIEDGRFQAALETLAGVPEQPGGDRYEIHYLRALANTGLRQFEAARASAETAARLGHGVADVHYLLAQICQQQGEIEPAIAHYRSATLAADRELNNVRVTLAWYFLGQMLAAAGYERAAAEAYAHFDSAIWQTHPEQRNAPEVAAVLAGRPHGMVIERLRLLRRLGGGEEAVRVAEWAGELWPDDPAVARLYAEALLEAGAAEQAFAFCHRRWEDPKSAAVLLPIAVDAARAAHRLDEWVDTLASGVAEGRGLEQAAELTRQLNRVDAPAQAVRLGRALLTRSPDDRELTWEVAAAQQAAGDLRGGLETLITFVRKRPDLARWSQQRLAAWTGWFEADVNVVELAKELRARPDADFATDFVLAVSALAAGQGRLAEELLKSCVAARPDYTPACVVRGQMLLATYQWDAAKAHADKVLKTRPDLAAAHYVLAEAHDGLDENEQAEQAYKQAIQLGPDEPAYRLALARHYRRLGNLRGAQRYFQETLEIEPGSGEALEELIDCYLRDGKAEIARVQLERIDRDAVPRDALRRVNTLMRFVSAPFGAEHLAALREQFELYPHDLATARYLAAGLYQWGRLDEACEVIQKGRAADLDDYHLTILLANVHADREEFDQAITLLTDLAKRYPNRPAVLELLALYSVYDFRLDEGRPTLQRLLELTEDEQKRNEYRERLRDSYLVFGEFDEALRLVEGWIEQEPKNVDLLRDKATVLIEAERGEEAFNVLEEWLDQGRGDRVRRERFCRGAADAGQPAQLAKRVRAWLEDEPSDATLTEWLIDALLLDGRSDEALEVAGKFEGTYVESLDRRIWLGRCRAAKGELDTALAEFDALLSERTLPADTRLAAYQQIVIALLDAGHYDQALERCEQWLKEAEARRDVFQALTLELKRRILGTAGRERECAEVMERLLPYLPVLMQLFDPKGREYAAGLFNDLGYTWVDLGLNVDQATELIRRALTVEPWNAAFIDSLGWAYYKAGDFTNARKYLARAVRLRDGQDPVVYDHLADAAYRLRDADAARQHWNKGLSLIEASLKKAETSEPERSRLADLAAAVRAKLAALERSEPPDLAPTAAEQNKE